MALALQNVREFEVGVRVNQRAVKHLTRHTEADEANVQGIRHADILSRRTLR